MKRFEIRIAGLGGQGIVMIGQVIGRAAVYDGMNVVQTQSYGAEARGSGAKSEVIISDGKIGFPFVRKCDLLVAMNQEAVDKNLRDLKPSGVLIVDDSIVKSVPKNIKHAYAMPATKIAEEAFGEKMYANMVILGAFVGITSIVSEESVEKAVADTFPRKTATLNVEAVKKGKELAASLYRLHSLDLNKL
ncbi:MAG: 2-oxoacid:acceptor oxidoreductase family protein [Candidatus Bathyarchaeota archaeon]|nr:2-oxoacid:acceptor oxidoreductase family protein [Candidatus Bathyarchaeota archaeon]